MQSTGKLTTFTVTMVVIDLVLCCIRLPMTGLAVFGMVFDPGAIEVYGGSAVLEVVSGLGISVFGILGNGMLLARSPIALTLCWINVGYFGLSVVTAVWQIGLMAREIQDEAQAAGVVVGGATILAIRIGLAACYMIALYQAHKSLTEPILAEVVR